MNLQWKLDLPHTKGMIASLNTLFDGSDGWRVVVAIYSGGSFLISEVECEVRRAFGAGLDAYDLWPDEVLITYSETGVSLGLTFERIR